MDKNPPLYGNYRAKVVDNKDVEYFGRVLVWIPDLMPEVDDKKGLWARPANNPVGGRNMENDDEHHYMGSSYIPKIGSWLFVFFECGNINRPYYFGALDLENTPVLPENQLGDNYEDKWTILKTHRGRCIIISDDPDDERVEITGKKRELTEPPTGDTASVYQIDGNMTTILMDERVDLEKILIRTIGGDFIHIDINEQMLQINFASDFQIKSGGDVYMTAEGDIHLVSNKDQLNIACATDINIKAANDINLQSQNDINIKAANEVNIESGAAMNLKAGAEMKSEASSSLDMKSGAALNIESGADLNAKAGANMNRQAGSAISDTASGLISLYGSGVNEMTAPGTPAASASPAGSAGDAASAVAATPEGERDT